ncbi:hypothetical protein WI80_30680 [Burkholderia ubonensis]|uniref:Uncharacterized protein n=1 Tax=Burkholderia ubonensis TaxID=101571 RepID=A0A103BT54_9BURK|nr:hypothetical protein [Burkholderia ubonensis]AOJ64524.1 hypothetical protein WJ32_18185 [Burkholderia ubonensis]AOJ64733.1 hypothetical protein WJ32_19495 [Burkholderia ubonensis]KVD21132.1 hypothetical protein WI80_30680 [Burkholderia ubonensis]KVD30242.1 hypothetical protein WI84_26595 [Burkholderia ubonensis]KVD54338.1 hypothetical protein WI86_10720 [Burkholderia ubonensis]
MARFRPVPTANELLAVMHPGVAYAPYVLASQFNLKADRIRPLLDEMLAAGQLSPIHVSNSRSCNVCIAGTEPRPAASDEKYVGVPAAPRRYFVMTGDLNAYAAELKRRADLCMMVRR